jgi:HTH-type transcriptional regulator / antitoxin MqsA
MYNYGKCPLCGKHMVEREISQQFWIEGKLIVVEGVPAGVCLRCGEKVVKAEVGQRLAILLQSPSRTSKARMMSVPVIRFEKQVA